MREYRGDGALEACLTKGEVVEGGEGGGRKEGARDGAREGVRREVEGVEGGNDTEFFW